MSDNPFQALVDTEAIEWIDSPGGNSYKPLWYSDETGAWSALIKAKAGTVNAAAYASRLGRLLRHLRLDGVPRWFRPRWCVDLRTGRCRARSNVASRGHVYLSNVRGPIAFHGPDGKVAYVSNGEGCASHRAREARPLRRPANRPSSWSSSRHTVVDLLALDATAQAELVSTGQCSPRELLEAVIDAIERVNPQINAVIVKLYDEARHQVD